MYHSMETAQSYQDREDSMMRVADNKENNDVSDLYNILDSDMMAFNEMDEFSDLPYENESESPAVMMRTAHRTDSLSHDKKCKIIYFDYDRNDIRADQTTHVAVNTDTVKHIINESIEAGYNPIIQINGHASEEGTAAYNISLSEKRAKTIADAFTQAGVSEHNIKIVAHGKEQPALLDGKPIRGRCPQQELNRRVEVNVLYS